MVEADTASGVARKGGGNEEWRSITRMIVQALRVILLPTLKPYSCESGISYHLHAQSQTPSTLPLRSTNGHDSFIVAKAGVVEHVVPISLVALHTATFFP
jgi:hypothetical protein